MLSTYNLNGDDMKLIKNLKKYLLTFLILLLLNIFYTILLYFKILDTNNITFKIFTHFLALITFFIITFLITSKAKKKGWLKGLLVGIILLMIPLMYNITSKNPFNIGIIIKYLSLLSSSILAGIINVNKNKEK